MSPSYLCSLLVRASRIIHCAMWPRLVHTLWPFTIQLVPALDGAGLRAREVGAGAGLGEALTPDLVAAQRRRHEAPLLLLGAVHEDRRDRHRERHDVQHERRSGQAHLAVRDPLEALVSAAAVLLRDVGADQTRVVAAPLPVLEVVAQRPVGDLDRQHGHPLGRRRRRVLGEPAARVLLELSLLGVEHRGSP